MSKTISKNCLKNVFPSLHLFLVFSFHFVYNTHTHSFCLTLSVYLSLCLGRVLCCQWDGRRVAWSPGWRSMVKHQPLQVYERQLCLSFLTGIYGCRWKRYQRSHDDTTKVRLALILECIPTHNAWYGKKYWIIHYTTLCDVYHNFEFFSEVLLTNL